MPRHFSVSRRRHATDPLETESEDQVERSELIEHLRISLSAILDEELPELTPETRFLEDLELDSMRFVELLMSVEDTLGLDVDGDSFDPDAFQTAGSLADYIRDRKES